MIHILIIEQHWFMHCVCITFVMCSLSFYVVFYFSGFIIYFILIIRDAPIDRPPIDIGRYSLSADWSVLSINADRESRSHDVKYMTLVKPFWRACFAAQYFKVSEKDNKIAVCNACEAEILQLRPLWRTGERSNTHTRVRPYTLSYLIYLWN